MQFHWDDANRNHIARHNVTPEDCEAAFEFLISTQPALGVDEPRWKTVGIVSGRRLTVIWTNRNELCRVVTAYWRSRK